MDSGLCTLATSARRPEPLPGRVLVIDDERPVREMFRRSLQLAGFDVVAATGGEEGFDVLHADMTIRLVLCDLNMPKMDGQRFRRIQLADARLAAIPTIIVTGSALPTLVHQELLATDYLLKPVGREHLLSVVSRYCLRCGPSHSTD